MERRKPAPIIFLKTRNHFLKTFSKLDPTDPEPGHFSILDSSARNRYRISATQLVEKKKSLVSRTTRMKLESITLMSLGTEGQTLHIAGQKAERKGGRLGGPYSAYTEGTSTVIHVLLILIRAQEHHQMLTLSVDSPSNGVRGFMI